MSEVRSWTDPGPPPVEVVAASDYRDALGRIERLRAALEKIAGEPGSWGNDYPATNAEISMERIAREALGAVVERDGWCMCGECNQRFPNAQALHDHKCNADETEPPR